MLSLQTSIPDARIRYLEFHGDGVPLLMIHGLGCASSFEYPHVATADALLGRRVILVDLLGFGFSDRPEDFGYRVSDHAKELCRFVQALKLEEIDVYGHSMGGSIAIELTDMLGKKVRRLILSEANLDSGGGEFSQPIARMGEVDYVRFGHSKTCEDAVASGDADWASTMRTAFPIAVYRGAASLVEGSSPSWRSRLLAHHSKAAFIFGERSLPNPDRDILASQGVRVIVLPDVGHSMGIENPQRLSAAIATAHYRL